MSVSLTLNQVRESVNNKYKVTSTITTSSGVEKEVFIKRTGSLYYDRVATVDDMLNLDTDSSSTNGYFRDYEFDVEYNDVTTADNLADGVKERLGLLVDAYDVVVNAFVGSDDTVFTSI